ncbi:AraC family transcriptional regulator [Halopseudomonas salegens]|uniref:AraC-type DNA-binding protein n=1 Tax=Halopseudomonas salegens TaxID=1434072 RepID=A0A1H2H000_9GAMM|nr:AraC family transcriptional regulator [Halopseudomonas salegens]SDU25192.1 AraC-type DNA-binding protein [Halopseudomonas salegens]
MDASLKVIPLQLYPAGFAEGFLRHGVGLKQLLQGTGISEQQFSRPDQCISYAQQRRLLQNGLRHCQVPGIGLRIGLELDWCFHGSVGYAVHCSPSLREAEEAFLRYQMIAQPFYALSVGRPLGYIGNNERYVYPLRCFPSPDADQDMLQFELEFRLAITVRHWDACGNHQVDDNRILAELACPRPAYAALFRELPCEPVRFGARQSLLSIHQDFRNQPSRPWRAQAFQHLVNQCEVELQAAGLVPTQSDAVRSQISLHFNRELARAATQRPCGPPDLASVAAALHVSPRVLSRRLSAEGTSFRQLLHQVRLRFCLYQLRVSPLSVEAIAELTGFGAVSSLRRTVKQATGQPISALRTGR